MFFSILNEISAYYRKLFLSSLLSLIFTLNLINKYKFSYLILFYILNILWYVVSNRIWFCFCRNKFVKYNLSCLYKEIALFYKTSFNLLKVSFYPQHNIDLFSLLYAQKKVMDLFIKCHEQILVLDENSENNLKLIHLFKKALIIYRNIIISFYNFIRIKNKLFIHVDAHDFFVNINNSICKINCIAEKIIFSTCNKDHLFFFKKINYSKKQNKIIYLYIKCIHEIDILLLDKNFYNYKEKFLNKKNHKINLTKILQDFFKFNIFSSFLLIKYLVLFLMVFCFTKYLGVNNRFYWIFVTIVLMYQNNFINTKIRLINRLLGTIGGVLLSIIISRCLFFKKYALFFLFFFMFFSHFFLRLFYNISTLSFILVNICNLQISFSDTERFLFLRLMDNFISFFILFGGIYLLYPEWNIVLFRRKIILVLKNYLKYIKDIFFLKKIFLNNIDYYFFVLHKNLNDLFNFYINFNQEIHFYNFFMNEIKLCIEYNVKIVNYINFIIYLLKDKKEVIWISNNNKIIMIYIKIIKNIIFNCINNINMKVNNVSDINYLLNKILFIKKQKNISSCLCESYLMKIIKYLSKIESIPIVTWINRFYFYFWLFNIMEYMNIF